MRIKTDGKNIYHNYFQQPQMKIAEFVDDEGKLTDKSKQDFVNVFNCGADMLASFEARGHSRDIEDVLAMINEMRRIFAIYKGTRHYNAMGDSCE